MASPQTAQLEALNDHHNRRVQIKCHCSHCSSSAESHSTLKHRIVSTCHSLSQRILIHSLTNMRRLISWFVDAEMARFVSRAQMAAEQAFQEAHRETRQSLSAIISRHKLLCTITMQEVYAKEIHDGLNLVLPLKWIDSGSFGKVYRSAAKKKNGFIRPVAIKAIFASSFTNSKVRLDQFKAETDAEVNYLSELKHPHIVRFFGAVRLLHYKENLPVAVFIALEYFEHNLNQLCTSPRPNMHLCLVGHFVRQIGSAVDYLHRRGIAHRDLKPGNILVKIPAGVRLAEALYCDGVIFAIADFGSASTYSLPNGLLSATVEIAEHPLGTLKYMSPELKEIYGFRDGSAEKPPVNPFLADSYAFGLILMLLLLGDDVLDRPIERGQDINALWQGHKERLCRQPNGDALVDDNGQASKWANPVAEAFEAIGNLVQTDPKNRRFVDKDFIALFKDF